MPIVPPGGRLEYGRIAAGATGGKCRTNKAILPVAGGRRMPQCSTRERKAPLMLTVSKDRALLTTITGSLPRPHWLSANLNGRPFSLATTDVAFREQYTDAVARRWRVAGGGHPGRRSRRRSVSLTT